MDTIRQWLKREAATLRKFWDYYREYPARQARLEENLEHYGREVDAALGRTREALRTTRMQLAQQQEPIPMLLACPECHTPHIDAPDTCEDEGCPHYGAQHSHPDMWGNPPHRTHLCASCGITWRPANVATTGVAVLPEVTQ